MQENENLKTGLRVWKGEGGTQQICLRKAVEDITYLNAKLRAQRDGFMCELQKSEANLKWIDDSLLHDYSSLKNHYASLQKISVVSYQNHIKILQQDLHCQASLLQLFAKHHLKTEQEHCIQRKQHQLQVEALNRALLNNTAHINVLKNSLTENKQLIQLKQYQINQLHRGLKKQSDFYAIAKTQHENAQKQKQNRFKEQLQNENARRNSLQQAFDRKMQQRQMMQKQWNEQKNEYITKLQQINVEQIALIKKLQSYQVEKNQLMQQIQIAERQKNVISKEKQMAVSEIQFQAMQLQESRTKEITSLQQEYQTDLTLLRQQLIQKQQAIISQQTINLLIQKKDARIVQLQLLLSEQEKALQFQIQHIVKKEERKDDIEQKIFMDKTAKSKISKPQLSLINIKYFQMLQINEKNQKIIQQLNKQKQRIQLQLQSVKLLRSQQKKMFQQQSIQIKNENSQQKLIIKINDSQVEQMHYEDFKSQQKNLQQQQISFIPQIQQLKNMNESNFDYTNKQQQLQNILETNKFLQNQLQNYKQNNYSLNGQLKKSFNQISQLTNLIIKLKQQKNAIEQMLNTLLDQKFNKKFNKYQKEEKQIFNSQKKKFEFENFQQNSSFNLQKQKQQEVLNNYQKKINDNKTIQYEKSSVAQSQQILQEKNQIIVEEVIETDIINELFTFPTIEFNKNVQKILQDKQVQTEEILFEIKTDEKKNICNKIQQYLFKSKIELQYNLFVNTKQFQKSDLQKNYYYLQDNSKEDLMFNKKQQYFIVKQQTQHLEILNAIEYEEEKYQLKKQIKKQINKQQQKYIDIAFQLDQQVYEKQKQQKKQKSIQFVFQKRNKELERNVQKNLKKIQKIQQQLKKTKLIFKQNFIQLNQLTKNYIIKSNQLQILKQQQIKQQIQKNKRKAQNQKLYNQNIKLQIIIKQINNKQNTMVMQIKKQQDLLKSQKISRELIQNKCLKFQAQKKQIQFNLKQLIIRQADIKKSLQNKEQQILRILKKLQQQQQNRKKKQLLHQKQITNLLKFTNQLKEQSQLYKNKYKQSNLQKQMLQSKIIIHSNQKLQKKNEKQIISEYQIKIKEKQIDMQQKIFKNKIYYQQQLSSYQDLKQQCQILKRQLKREKFQLIKQNTRITFLQQSLSQQKNQRQIENEQYNNIILQQKAQIRKLFLQNQLLVSQTKDLKIKDNTTKLKLMSLFQSVIQIQKDSQIYANKMQKELIDEKRKQFSLIQQKNILIKQIADLKTIISQENINKQQDKNNIFIYEQKSKKILIQNEKLIKIKQQKQQIIKQLENKNLQLAKIIAFLKSQLIICEKKIQIHNITIKDKIKLLQQRQKELLQEKNKIFKNIAIHENYKKIYKWNQTQIQEQLNKIKLDDQKNIQHWKIKYQQAQKKCVQLQKQNLSLYAQHHIRV